MANNICLCERPWGEGIDECPNANNEECVRAQLANALKLIEQLQPKPQPIVVEKGCNMHKDCKEAESLAEKQGKPLRFGSKSIRLTHCADDTCEDCFGY